jgi:protein-S-isoprenylcysteine O-methyltransferase Ste14
MNDEDIDRVLSEAPIADPGPAFTRTVMARIRREAASPAPIPFPWRRFLIGAVPSGACVVAALVAVVSSGVPLAPAFDTLAPHDAERWSAVLLACAALLGSWLSVRACAMLSEAGS